MYFIGDVLIIPIHICLYWRYKITVFFFKIFYLLNTFFIHILGSINRCHHD
nr:MAG TPA: hypothetical protein [Caudoviricetes sp.]